MKIVVLVKEVPDTYGDRKLNLETGLADRDANERVLDEIAERALETALSYRDASGDAEIVLLSMSPSVAAASVRKGLAMGADHAVHIVDERLAGADLTLTAEVLAAALKRIEFDLVLAGNVSTDGSAGAVPAMLGELLVVPSVTNLSALEISSERVTGVRITDTAVLQVYAPLPAIASITEALPDPRYPTFKGIMAAKKKALELLTLSDLGVDPDDFSVPRSIMTTVSEKPPRTAGVKIIDEGDAGAKLADYLSSNGLA